jgi:hypothetical protein
VLAVEVVRTVVFTLVILLVLLGVYFAYRRPYSGRGPSRLETELQGDAELRSRGRRGQL